MAQSTRRGNGAFVVGVLVGGVIGAGWGLWKAPASGAETRQRLLSFGSEARVKAEQAVVGERVEDSLAEGKALARQQAGL